MITKNNMFYLFLFCLFLISAFIISYVIAPVNCDEIWSFGFSYNLTKGLMIYKDYNVLQTPLYFFIGKIFILLFGKHMISIHIFNSIIMALIGLLLFNKIKWHTIIIYLLLLVYNPSPYNLLCLFFLMIIITIIDKEDMELFISLIIGLIFITKQNIGIALLPIIFLFKDKKRSLLMFLTPFLLLSIYLIINNAFLSFINQSFLGMLDFNNSNKKVFSFWLVLELLSLIYLLYLLYKNKSKEVLFVLLFQIMNYPIVDPDHFIVSFVPVFYLICKNIKIKNFYYILYAFLISLLLLGLPNQIHIHLKNDLFLLRSPSEFVDVSKYTYDYFDGNLKNVYSDSEHMYFTKIYYDEPISEFDFLVSGNMGYKGSEKKFKKLKDYCSKNDCYFLLTDTNFYQTEELRDFVKENYQKIDEFSIFSVYH